MIAAQLASNALWNIAPGGGRSARRCIPMLVLAGLDGPATVSALTAVNLLAFGGHARTAGAGEPRAIRGAVNRRLLEAAFAGVAAFVVTSGVVAVLLTTDRLLVWVGRVA